MNNRIIIVEETNAVVSSWTEPFTNLIDVVKNTFAKFLNVSVTMVRLFFTFDTKEVFEIVDKYYDRMKTLNAESAEIMKRVEAGTGDMNLFAFVYNPAETVMSRVLMGGPGALRNFIDFYKESTGESLNPFDIGPPGASDSTRLMNNRMNFAMGYGMGGSSGGGRGTASARYAKQIEQRLNRAFGILPSMPRGGGRGGRTMPMGPMGGPMGGSMGAFESYRNDLPILVEQAQGDEFKPLTDEEFKTAVKHFMGQVDFEKLGVKSDAKKVSSEMDSMADDLALKLSKPYDLLLKMSQTKDSKEMYRHLTEMKGAGFQVKGVEELKPDRIKSLVDETIEKAKDEDQVNMLFDTSSVKPKDPRSPTEDEIKAAAQELVTKTVISKIVVESKKQVESSMVNAKKETLKKFDDTILPKNKKDADALMKTDFGKSYKAARSKIENAGMQIQSQLKVDTKV
jgi:hypothetical protein